MKDKNVDGEKFMNNWLNQRNYPLVTIDLEENAENGNSIVKVSQKRFLLSENSIQLDDPDESFEWLVYLKCQLGRSSQEIDYETIFLDGKTSKKF